jgi:hypothetical protein
MRKLILSLIALALISCSKDIITYPCEINHTGSITITNSTLYKLNCSLNDSQYIINGLKAITLNNIKSDTVIVTISNYTDFGNIPTRYYSVIVSDCNNTDIIF